MADDVGVKVIRSEFSTSVFIELLISELTTNPSLRFVESFLITFFICSLILILYINPFSSSSSSIKPPWYILLSYSLAPDELSIK